MICKITKASEVYMFRIRQSKMVETFTEEKMKALIKEIF